MHLRRLELVGFKSFAARTALEFEPGLCAIVGPNGSGKSNLSDAIRWALGEQSARAVRSRRAEEVIFAGGAGRQPLGMAEVSLVLDNADGRLPLPLAEVRITRRLYRDGTSEYLLNGARARLKDLEGLLARAGLGPDSYCVVGQGQVDELLLQRPEERRAAFETAAGIGGYQARLGEARARLAATEANLTRCCDLIAELEPHVRRLRVQAERAERRQRLQAEYAALALAWHRWALWEGRSTLARAEQELAAATDRLAAAEARALDLRERRAAAERELADLDGRLSALEAEHAALSAERARLERESAVQQERARNLGARAEQLAQDAERLAARQRAAEQELALRALAVRAAEAAQAAASARLADLEAAARAGGLQRDRGRAGVPAAAERAAPALQAAEQARRQVAALERALEEARRAERAAAEAQARRERELSVARALLADRASARVALELRLAEAERRVAAARALTEQARGEWRAARDALGQAQAELGERRSALLAAQAALERLDAERAALEKARAALWPPGGTVGAPQDAPEAGGRPAFGPLLARLQVAAEWQAAIAAALGAAAGAVVVGPPAARAALDAGAALVVAEPADGREIAARADLRRAIAAVLDGLPWLGFADQRVETAPPAAPDPDGPADPLDAALGRLLGTTALVPDLATAVEAAGRLRAAQPAGPWQVATLAGQVVRSDGVWLAGGGVPNATAVALGCPGAGAATQALAVERELADLEARRAPLAAALGAAEAALSPAEAAASERAAREARLRSELARREQEERAVLARREELERELRALEADLARRRAELERAERARPERDQPPGGRGPQRSPGPVGVPERAALERRLEDARRALDEATARAERERAAAEAARAELEAGRAALALRQSELAAARALLDRARQEAARDAAALRAAEQAREQARAAADEAAAQAAAAAELAQAAAAELAPLEQTLGAARAERKRLTALVRELDDELAAPRAALAAARAEREAALLARQRARDELDRRLREAAEVGAELADAAPDWPLQLRLDLEAGGPSVGPLQGPQDVSGASWDGSPQRDSHRVGVPDAPPRGSQAASGPPGVPQPAPPDAQARRRLHELRRELAALGPVAPDAVAEYRALAERLAFLEAQSADLRQAMAAIETAIAELEELMRSRFAATVEQVNAAFGDCFQALFGGGEARLMLTRPDDPLGSGVEVVARPPGKRLQSLLTLSGGERALVTIALLFALLKVSPAPFCVLDEVDAALDEANVERFLKLLRAFAPSTQFLLVTHNRATMEVAAAVYGVTMDPQGVTKVVSLRPAAALRRAAPA